MPQADSYTSHHPEILLPDVVETQNDTPVSPQGNSQNAIPLSGSIKPAVKMDW